MGVNNYIMGLGVVFAFFDAFGIGANDVANSFATSVNSGVLTMTQVAFVAPVMEFLGAMLAGSQVASTIQKGVLNVGLFKNKAPLLQMGMLCALMASSSFLQLANYWSLPVSTTHSIVGAVMGIGIAAFGAGAINWGFSGTAVNGIIQPDGFAPIAVSWVVSPVVSGLIAMVLFALTKYVVMRSNAFSTRIARHPFYRAMILAPWFYGLVGAILVLLLAYKGTSATSNAGALAAAANDSTTLGLASGLTALALVIFGYIWVSWWQFRVTWMGEDLKTWEWVIHPCIRHRPTRPGFNADHLRAVEEANADGVMHDEKAILELMGIDSSKLDTAKKIEALASAGGTAVVAPSAGGVAGDDTSTPTAAAGESKESAAVVVHAPAEPAVSTTTFARTAFLANLTDMDGDIKHATLDQHKVKVVPAEIKAAQAVAVQHGWLMREKTESERVMDEYRNICLHGSWLDRLLCPVRGLLCNGIMGDDGKERQVRDYANEDPVLRAMHHTSEKFDPLTERFFKQLQILTCCIASFAHGSNDVANAMGPFSVIYGVWSGQGAVGKYPVYDWILAFGGVSISLGFLIYGYHLMRSLGNTLTFHSPSRGYCMEFGAAVTVIIASRMGLPISTTQCLVGATMGVGMMDGVRAVNWRRFAVIFGGWVLTVPLVGTWAGCMYAFVIYSPNVPSPAYNSSP